MARRDQLGACGGFLRVYSQPFLLLLLRISILPEGRGRVPWAVIPATCSLNPASPVQAWPAPRETRGGLGAGGRPAPLNCIHEGPKALLLGSWLCPWGRAFVPGGSVRVPRWGSAGFIPDPQESKAAVSRIPVLHPAGAAHSLSRCSPVLQQLTYIFQYSSSCSPFPLCWITTEHILNSRSVSLVSYFNINHT